MNFLNYLFLKTFKYDLVNKYIYKNTNTLPKLEKIILIFNSKNNEIKKLSACLLALQLISKQKGVLTTTKNSNILLKIRKGSPVGCKVILRNQKMLLFFYNFLIEIIPKTKNFESLMMNKKSKNTFSFNFKDIMVFNELEKNYSLFNSIPTLNITIVINSQIKKEINFLINSFKIPTKKVTQV